MHIIGEGVELIELHSDLAQGSLAGCRKKFAKSNQAAVVEKIVAELENGTLYLGDWTKGEIQIVGIKRLITNRFWTEVEYDVLFPPKPGMAEPARGTYRNVRWNSGVDAGAGALCITRSGEIVLLHSFRHAVRRWTLELPRGIRKPDETPEQCALREAQEECGVVITDDTQIINLGIHDPDTGIVYQEVPIIALTNVEVDEAKVSRDVSESTLAPVVLSLREFLDGVSSGQIKDGWIRSAVLVALARGIIQFPN